MIVLDSPKIGTVLQAGYEAFRRMLADGECEFGLNEVAIGASHPDAKRYIEFGAKDDAGMPAAVRDLRLQLCNVLNDQLELISTRLPLATGSCLADLIDRTNGPVLRLSWYAAGAVGEVNHPHTDIDLFTMLPQATGPGLQLWASDGWHAANLSSDEVLILPGDMLKHFGGVPAVLHRVVGGDCGRISASLFVNAEPTLATRQGIEISDIFAQRLTAVRANHRTGS